MTSKRSQSMAITLVIVIITLIISTIDCLADIKFRVVHFGELVDNESGSSDCLSCHDGLAVKEVGFQNWSHRSSADPLGSHPIEAPYPSEWSGSTKFALIPEIQKSGLRLLEGKVTCITCHDLRLQNRGKFLPVSMKGSALCLTCHRI